MMKNISLPIAIMFSLVLVFTTFSCKKYVDDGNYISLSKPEKRIADLWKFTFVIENKVDVTSDFLSHNILFKENGTIVYNYKENISGSDVQITKGGSWRFTNTYRNLEINIDSFTQIYEIKSLTQHEISLRSINMIENRLLLLKKYY